MHDQIRFLSQGRFSSLRQAQLQPLPFDADRLRAVALMLRQLYPATDRQRLERLVSIAFDEPDYVPDEAWAFTAPTDPTPEEQYALSGTRPAIEDDGGLVPQKDV